MKTYWSAGLAVVTLIASGAVHAQDANTGGRLASRTVRTVISTVGSGEVRVKPDIVEFTIGVQETGLVVPTLRTSVAKKMTAVVAAIRKQGIAKNEIQTDRISIDRTWQRSAEPNPTNKGRWVWSAQNSVVIRTGLLDKAGDVLEAAVNAGANTVDGPSFDLKDRKPIERDALESALKDARAKADRIASVEKVLISGVESVMEQGTEPMPEIYRAKSHAAYGSPGAPAMFTMPVLSGVIVVSSQVTVTYRFQ